MFKIIKTPNAPQFSVVMHEGSCYRRIEFSYFDESGIEARK